MNNLASTNSLISRANNINIFLYFISIASLVLSNSVNSISIIALVVFNFTIVSKQLFQTIIKDRIVLLFFFFFFILIISCFFSNDKEHGLYVIERNLSLLFLPTIIGISVIKDRKFDLRNILKIFVITITLLLVLSLIIAFYKNAIFNIENDYSQFRFKSWFFTYHYLAGNINISAIYMSLYLAFALVLLTLDVLGFEKLNLNISITFKIVWLLLLVVFFFLLSARTSIASTSLILFFFSFKKAREMKKTKVFILVSLVIIAMLCVVIYNNDVLRLRFFSAFEFHEKSQYFSGGLSSRAFQWKALFVELWDKNNLFFGVGIGDVNASYIEAYNRFGLDWAIRNNFNAHNMYLEILFSMGIMGLSVLILILMLSFHIAFKTKNYAYRVFLILFLMAGLTESLLNRQYGLIYFLLFNHLFYFNVKFKATNSTMKRRNEQKLNNLKLKIAILGTRGIPNHHGGFEQFAEYFSVYLAKMEHDVYVFNSHNHPYQEKTFKGVNITHCYDPEYKIGTMGQFIYDLNCIRDARKRNFDIVLQLGYTSSSIWHWLMPQKSIVVTNMDGLEWKRSKYKPIVRSFLKYAEKLGAKYSDYLIADSVGIQEYLYKTYKKESEYIAYGANNFTNPKKYVLSKYHLSQYKYSMLIARLEPENNIETIIKGYIKSTIKDPLIIVGGLNEYGNVLKERYGDETRVLFVGPNYNQEELNNLRYYSRYYFHGHSVGGTNPSLLEAMASRALIIANNNIFNKSILEERALYFDANNDITELLNRDDYFSFKEKNGLLNMDVIDKEFSWELINEKYETFLLRLMKA